jgi:EpsI family protein
MHVAAPTIAGWSGPQAATNGWRPVFNGAAAQVRASYQAAAGGEVVELFHAVYTGKPRRGHSLITYGNDLYDVARARLLSRASRRVELANGLAMTAGELRLADATGPRLVWYWYSVDRRCTRSPVLTKLLQAWTVLRGQKPRSSVWALSSPVVSDAADQTRTKLRAFAHALPAPGTANGQAQQPVDAVGSTP